CGSRHGIMPCSRQKATCRENDDDGFARSPFVRPTSLLCIVAPHELRDSLQHLGQQHLLLPVVEPPVVRLAKWLQSVPIKTFLVFLLSSLRQFAGSVDGVVFGGPPQHILFIFPPPLVVSRGAVDAAFRFLE